MGFERCHCRMALMGANAKAVGHMMCRPHVLWSLLKRGVVPHSSVMFSINDEIVSQGCKVKCLMSHITLMKHTHTHTHKRTLTYTYTYTYTHAHTHVYTYTHTQTHTHTHTHIHTHKLPDLYISSVHTEVLAGRPTSIR